MVNPYKHRNLDEFLIQQRLHSNGARQERFDYKARSASGQSVRVAPKHTIQRRFGCGGLSAKALTLNDRRYQCAQCDYRDDCNVNAAKTVMLKGFTLFDVESLFPQYRQLKDVIVV